MSRKAALICLPIPSSPLISSYMDNTILCVRCYCLFCLSCGSDCRIHLVDFGLHIFCKVGLRYSSTWLAIFSVPSLPLAFLNVYYCIGYMGIKGCLLRLVIPRCLFSTRSVDFRVASVRIERRSIYLPIPSLSLACGYMHGRIALVVNKVLTQCPHISKSEVCISKALCNPSFHIVDRYASCRLAIFRIPRTPLRCCNMNICISSMCGQVANISLLSEFG